MPQIRLTMRTAVALALAAASLSCSPVERETASSGDNAGIDSLNARIVRAYRTHDPEAYGALYTDSAIFEWPAFDSPRGRAAMAAMVRGNWASLKNMDLRLTVATRRLAADHATEFGAFEQSWSDSAGVRHAEFGRYVSVLARGEDGTWLIDRFFGFADSTRVQPSRR